MKFNTFLNFVFILFIHLGVGHAATQLNESDTIVLKKRGLIAKKGVNFFPFPEFAIDPFLGVYLGLSSSVYDFGDGKRYPNYYKQLKINANYGTKGKRLLSLDYKLYKKQIVYIKGYYSVNQRFPFYGFNGYESKYNEDFHHRNNSLFITEPFYEYAQTQTGLTFMIQDTIQDTRINWSLGFNLRWFTCDRVDFNSLNVGLNQNDSIPDRFTLYDYYGNWGLIPEGEYNGGWMNDLKIGIIYDTRSSITNPEKGLWSEINISIIPEFLGNYSNTYQFSFIHRQYLSIIPQKLTFAYRIWYDAVFGKIPFYGRQNLINGREGFGGAATLLGIFQNRIIANQIALANFELRIKWIEFQKFNQNWSLSGVPLFHIARIFKTIPIDYTSITQAERTKYFVSTPQKFYPSLGYGFKLVINDNSVIGIDWGHSFNDHAGKDLIYLGYGYTF